MKQPKIIHIAPSGSDWTVILPIWLLVITFTVGILSRLL